MDMSGNIAESDSFRRKKGIQLKYERISQNKKNNIIPSYAGVPTDDNRDDRDEKPWQRVVDELTRKGRHLYEPVRSVPSEWLVVLLKLYLLLAFLTQLVEDDMPSVINDADIATGNSETFSEESAWRYLYQIMGDEPRVSGTRYHLNKTADMKALVDGIAASATQTVRTDWQFASGDYGLNKIVNRYDNASNVIAVLEGESGFESNGSSRASVLFNCHYDSVPYALGASDNVVFCAVMAETLSRLSKSDRKFKNNLVFLFNGAEENLLQASHAFLQHPWSHGVTTVVNLDAAGMNGKAAIFQVTDPRVLAAYKRTAYRPNAQGLGEFLFSTGIIPSDTDFRVFRDFGQIHGIDMAFTKWGHVYHTRYDRPDLIHPGVLQWAGNMLLPLAATLADMDELQERAAPAAAVYFDYVNVLLVTYSLAAAHAVDLLTALVGITSVAYCVWLVGPRMSTLQELMYAVAGRLVAMVAGVIPVAIMTPIMVATTTQLRYLASPWLVVPFYWVPYLMAAVAVSQLYDSWRTKKSGLNRSIRTLQAMAATRLLLSVVLLVLCCVPSLVSVRYVVSAPLLIMSAMALVSLTVVRYIGLTGWQHLAMEVALSLPASMFTLSLALRMDSMILPIMGRSSTDTPDYTVAVINVGLAIIVCCTVSGIELLFSRKRLWMVMSLVGAVCVVLMFIPFSPYQDEGPATQRHYWFHSQISTYSPEGVLSSRTSGVLVTRWDALALSRTEEALRTAGLRLNSRRDFATACQRHVYCDLPVFRSSWASNLSRSMFLYTDPPLPFWPAAAASLVSRDCFGETCTYSFNVTGANHNLVTIWPRSNVNLTSWSLSAPVEPAYQLLDRPVYVIYQSTATYSEVTRPVVFNATFIVPLSLQSQPAMDFSHHSHKIHHPEDYTAEYSRIVQAMPDYFNIASFQSYRDNYVF